MSRGADLAVMTIADLERFSGFCGRTIRRAIDAGELPASKIRNRWLVWPADYRAWIDAGRVARKTKPRTDQSPGSSAAPGSIERLKAMEEDE